jgi:hypothetical protein
MNFSAVLARGFWILFGVLLILLLLAQLRVAVETDMAYNLYAAEKLLGGGNYPDQLYDINPPLIVLLNVPPIVVAHLLSISPLTAFIFYLFALVVFCLAVIVLAVRPRFDDTPYSGALMLVALAVLELALPGPDFGQREHFVCILSVPYLCLVARRWQMGPQPLGVTVLCVTIGCLGLFLKPTLLLLPLAVFIVDASRERGLRRLFGAENLTFAFCTLLYLAVICLFFPNFLAIAADGVFAYSGFGSSASTTVAAVTLTAVLPGLFCLALIGPLKIGGPVTSAMELLALFLMATAATAFLQMKDWGYHFLPVHFACGLMGVVIALVALRRWREGAWSIASAALLIAATSAVTGQNIMTRQSLAQGRGTIATLKRDVMFSALRAELDGAPVMSLSPYIGPTNVVMYGGAKWVTRFPALFIWPFINGGLRELAALPPDLRERVMRMDLYLRKSIAEDISLHKPKFVFVEAFADARDRQFGAMDMLPYFLKDSDFTAAWADYALRDDPKAINGLLSQGGRLWRVYERRDGAARH